MFMKFLGAAASAAILATGSQAAAATITHVIDTFDGTQWVSDKPHSSGTPSNHSEISAGVLGDYRELAVTNTAGTGGEMETELRVAGGSLSFSNIDGAQGTGTLTYDGTGNTGLGGISLLTANTVNPYFFFEPGVFDNEAYFSATVTDTHGNSATYGETITTGFDPKLYFSAFTGVDFSSLNSLLFSIDSAGNFSVDGSIKEIRVEASPVPLPASALLLLGGIGGLSALRRRKKA